MFSSVIRRAKYYCINIYHQYKFKRTNNKYIGRGTLVNCKIKLTGEGNVLIIEDGCYLNHVSIEISGKNNLIHLKEGVVFQEGGRIRIANEGNQLLLSRSMFINVFFALDDFNCKLIVGEHSLFSAQVVIRTGDSHSILDMDGHRVNPGKDVLIGNHVWIGYGATILKGTVIGNDCIVGTQSVVSGITVPANSICAGNPAKVVKGGRTWSAQLIR